MFSRKPYTRLPPTWRRLGFAALCVGASWSAPSLGAPGDILFQEQFDNTGDYNSDWSDSGSGDAAVNTDSFNSGPRSLSIGEDTHTVTSDAGRIDTSGITGAELSLWIRRGDNSFSNYPEAGEDLVFEYLSSGGTWTSLATYAGGGTGGEVFTPTFTLPNDALYAGLRLRFRFLQGSGNNFDYWHIDDVVVTETGIVNPPGLNCGTYADNFDSASYTNSDGTLDWSSNAWSETNDNGSASSGLIQISGGQLELTGNNTTSNTAITREADTSTAYQLTLDFDFAMLGGIEADDEALLEISSNGGSSWTTLETFVGFSDGDTGSRSYDIIAYAASNMQIRFAVAPDDNSGTCCFGGGGERMEIDNLAILSCAVIVPVPIADYRLDESSWSGSANEVLDNSGNGLHGQAVNLSDLPTTDDSNPAIGGDPGTCGYGEFDGTSDGYVEIADPGTGSILDLTSNLSVAVWIYPTALPSGGNLATIVSKDENFEFHLNSSGQVFWWWGGGSRQLTTSGSVTLNAWNHIAITYESGSQVIYINGVSQGTNSDSTAITTNNDPLLIGTDWAFHTRRFTGLIDEVKVYDTTLEAVQVDYVMNETHACPASSLDHYLIGHASPGITCEAVAVSITAHDSGDGTITVGGRTIQITATSATAGWTAADTTWTLGSGGGSFSTPSPGVAEYQFAAGESTVVLDFANISEAVIDFDVEDQGNTSITDVEGSAEDPTLTFSGSGLRFYNDADGDGDRDGTDPIATPLTAGTPSNQLIVAAIRTNTDTGQCEARATGTHTVNIGYQCVNPIACFRSDDADVNGTAIGENNLGITANLNPVSLTFDADGEAPFNLEYYDAGAIRLYAELPLAASGSDPAITLSGTSDDTVVRPADLAITAITDSTGTISNPGTTLATPGFLPSNSLFYVTVQAVNADGGLTPNFGTEIVNEGIVLVPQSLIMPAGGGTLAALSSASSFTPTGTPGEFQNTSLRWPEAGTFTMQAQISGDGDYLGSGNILGTTSGNVGRFYPNQFDLAVTSVSEGCSSGGFTYMSDQAFSYSPIDMNFSITAQAIGGGTTSNYDSTFGYPVRGFNAVAENANDANDRSTRTSIQSSTWSGGVYTLNGLDVAGFRRDLSGINEIPDGPYASLQLGLMPNSAGPDTINFVATDLTMHPTQSNDCITDGDCNAAALGSPLNLRFGRLYGANAHGPETAPLSVPLRMEFWNGTEFTTNATDDCTRIAASDILFDGNPLSTDANRTVTLGGGTTTGTFVDIDPNVDIGFSNGDADLNFTAPGAGNNGSFVIDINLTDYPWLRSDWNEDGDHANDTALPGLEIFFGRYRGHDRVIYWEEVLN